MSSDRRSLLDIAHEGDIKALNEALAAGVYVNMTGGVSLILCKSKDNSSEDTAPYSICFHQDGYTALMLAAQEGYHECLSILLAHGADLDITNDASRCHCSASTDAVIMP